MNYNVVTRILKTEMTSNSYENGLGYNNDDNIELQTIPKRFLIYKKRKLSYMQPYDLCRLMIISR